MNVHDSPSGGTLSIADEEAGGTHFLRFFACEPRVEMHPCSQSDSTNDFNSIRWKEVPI